MYKYIYLFIFSVIKWITLSTKNLYLYLSLISGEVEKQNITNSNKNYKNISISDEFYFSTKAVSSSSTVEKLNSFIMKVDNIKFLKKSHVKIRKLKYY